MTYKRGSRGEVVKQIQNALAAVGLKVIADGVFGVITEEAVKVFQMKNGLKPDGVVGVATMAKLGIAKLKQNFSLRKSNRVITEIIVHCTATPEGREVSMDELRKWHKQRGFSDVGYHYVVHLDGEVENGRSVNLVGAHCSGHNTHSIGVCYVGGVAKDGKTPKDTRTEKQKAALLCLLMDLRELYPNAKIIGHRDTSPDLNGNGIVEPCEFVKSCPSYDARSEYSRLV